MGPTEWGKELGSLSYRGKLRKSELEAQGKLGSLPSSVPWLDFRLFNVQFNSSWCSPASNKEFMRIVTGGTLPTYLTGLPWQLQLQKEEVATNPGPRTPGMGFLTLSTLHSRESNQDLELPVHSIPGS